LKEHLKKVLADQFFSRLYYGCEVWQNQVTSARTWRILNTLHYQVLRVIMKDLNNSVSRSVLDSAEGQPKAMVILYDVEADEGFNSNGSKAEGMMLH